jgi:hypothetical protein
VTAVATNARSKSPRRELRQPPSTGGAFVVGRSTLPVVCARSAPPKRPASKPRATVRSCRPGATQCSSPSRRPSLPIVTSRAGVRAHRTIAPATSCVANTGGMGRTNRPVKFAAFSKIGVSTAWGRIVAT